MKFPFLFLLVALLACNMAQADERKPYANAPWLSEKENQNYANQYSTSGAWVYINMKALSFNEGDWGALHHFAGGIKRYKQATRFLASWDTLMPEYQEFDRWIYDRNQEKVLRQRSPDGKAHWNSGSTVMFGVTDEMIARAAKDKNNTVFDLLRFGATNGNVWREGREGVISKSDPRVAARRTEFLNKEEPKTKE